MPNGDWTDELRAQLDSKPDVKVVIYNDGTPCDITDVSFDSERNAIVIRITEGW